MKKFHIVFVVVFAVFLAAMNVSADYCEEFRGWIEVAQNREKELNECKGFGSITPSTDFPCDKAAILKISSDVIIQKYICDKPGDKRDESLSLDNYEIKFTSIDNYTNTSGKDILELKIEFTNNSNEATSYNSALYREYYQDGFELENYILGDIDTMTKIRPGMTIEVTECYEIRPITNKGIIEIDVHPYFDGNKAHAYSGVIYRLK